MSAATCDVLVVGGGGAGLAAAITAAELGSKVILVEKGDALGGSTGRAIGSVTAAGTPDQRAAGVQDSAAAHFADLPAWAGPLAHRDNLELGRVLTQNAAGAIAWLRESGLELYGPLPEPPHRKPRMHVVLPDARALMHHLPRRARRAGVEVRLATPALRLVREDSQVRGVQTPQGGIRAARGVVLAGGDFSAGREFRREFATPAHQELPAVNPLATGDCQRMAREVGAVVVNGDLAFGEPRYRLAPPASSPWWRSLPPVRPLTSLMRFGLRRLPPPLIRPLVLGFVTTALAPEAALLDKAILVNAQGDLFRRDGEGLGFAIARQPGQCAYALLDAALRESFSCWPNYVSTAPGVAYAYIDDYRRNRPDVCAVADTLDAVARLRGLAPARLRASAGERLLRGPYLLLGPIRSCTVLADGGLAVSARMEVLDAAGAPIRGLYAAGSSGQGGLLLRGHGHHLAWAFVSGRIAGAQAAH